MQCLSLAWPCYAEALERVLLLMYVSIIHDAYFCHIHSRQPFIIVPSLSLTLYTSLSSCQRLALSWQHWCSRCLMAVLVLVVVKSCSHSTCINSSWLTLVVYAKYLHCPTSNKPSDKRKATRGWERKNSSRPTGIVCFLPFYGSDNLKPVPGNAGKQEKRKSGAAQLKACAVWLHCLHISSITWSDYLNADAINSPWDPTTKALKIRFRSNWIGNWKGKEIQLFLCISLLLC